LAHELLNERTLLLYDLKTSFFLTLDVLYI
jgi:hypothetical protein